MVPISQVLMQDADATDGLDHPLDQGSMASVGHTSGGIVLCLMNVSKTLVGGHIKMCTVCGLSICPTLSAVAIANRMYLKLMLTHMVTHVWYAEMP